MLGVSSNAPESLTTEGQARYGQHDPSTQSLAFSWDDSTIVDLEADCEHHGFQRFSRKSYSFNNKPAKPEIYSCIYDSCPKRFIGKEELENHIEVAHSTDEDNVDKQDTSLQACSLSSAIDEQHAVSSLLHETDVDLDGRASTIRPGIPVTADSLKALEAVNSMQPASVKDRQQHQFRVSSCNTFAKIDSINITQSLGSLSLSDIRRSPVSLDERESVYSVLDGYEEDPGSDVADQESPLIRVSTMLILTQWKQLLASFCQNILPGVRQHNPGPGSNATKNPASQSKESLTSQSETSSHVSSTYSHKRRTSDEGDDDRHRKHQKTKVKTEQADEDGRPLACPFNKHDSYAFGADSANSDYHSCSTFNSVKTAHFKQHLTRTHCVPEYQCDRCGINCVNHKKLREHRRSNPPCQVQIIDQLKIMPEDQTELKLHGRNPVGLDRESYWYQVYDIVFGREERIERSISPYYQGPSHEILQRLRRFSSRIMPQIIQTSRETLPLRVQDSQDDVELGRQIVEEVVSRFMDELRTNPVTSLPSSRTAHTISAGENDGEDRTIVPRNPRYTQIAPQPTTIWTNVSRSDQEWTDQIHHEVEHRYQMPLRPAPETNAAWHNPHFDATNQSFPHVSGQAISNWDPDTFNAFDEALETSDMYGTDGTQSNIYDGFTVISSPPQHSRQERPFQP